MDIQKEHEAFEAHAQKIYVKGPIFEMSDGKYIFNEIRNMWDCWQAGKAQAVPEWIDYTKQSPRIDGRYQIFISGEQLTADWESPYGFTCPQEGCAFIQEIISHWASLPEPPKAQEQSHDS